jgi:hypothetical protein
MGNSSSVLPALSRALFSNSSSVSICGGMYGMRSCWLDVSRAERRSFCGILGSSCSRVDRWGLLVHDVKVSFGVCARFYEEYVRESIVVDIEIAKQAVSAKSNVRGISAPCDVCFGGEVPAFEVVEGVAKEKVRRTCVALGGIGESISDQEVCVAVTVHIACCGCCGDSGAIGAVIHDFSIAFLEVFCVG